MFRDMDIVSVPRTIVRPQPLLQPATIRTDAPTHAAPDVASDIISARTARNEAVDVVRLLAAAGVVFVHACQSEAIDPWRNMFRFAVPFYLFASLYFQSLSLRRNPQRTLPQYVAGRFSRLYVPFLLWSLIYLLAHDSKRLLFGSQPVSLRPSVLWTGTEYHLWFLPFLMLASIVLAIIHRTLLQHHLRLRWLAIFIAIGCGVAFALAPMPAAGIETIADFTNVYSHWWRAAPAACWAMAFAWLMTLGSNVSLVPLSVGFAGVAIMLACSLKQVASGIQIIPRSLTGLGCMLAALAPWRGAGIAWLARYGRHGYGIYLCHVLFVEPLHVVRTRLHLTPSVATDLTTFVLAFAGSLILVQLLSRSATLKRLNG
ncbi:acyltransferase family protein [soil metagenome]